VVELVGSVHTLVSMSLQADSLLLRSQVFPSHVRYEGGVMKQSALAKLQEKRARLKEIQNAPAA
jgi:hypothetical protein